MDIVPFVSSQGTLGRAMEERHSVRQYLDRPLPEELIGQLRRAADAVNEECGTSIQLVVDEPRAFRGFRSRASAFQNVRNYFALIGPEFKQLDQLLGYAGEKLVLDCQAAGLNTCWVGASYKMVKEQYQIVLGQKLAAVIAVGYGADAGKPHQSISPEAAAPQYESAPTWFRNAVDAALLAPTALNRQKFRFKLLDDVDGVPQVKATTKRGPFTQMDLGIAQLHFEIGANAPFQWA